MTEGWSSFSPWQMALQITRSSRMPSYNVTLSLCLSSCLLICLSVWSDCLLVSLSICVSLHVCLSIWLYVCQPEFMNVALLRDLLLSVSVTLSVSIYHCLSDCLLVCLSVHFAVSICLSVCLKSWILHGEKSISLLEAKIGRFPYLRFNVMENILIISTDYLHYCISNWTGL